MHSKMIAAFALVALAACVSAGHGATSYNSVVSHGGHSHGGYAKGGHGATSYNSVVSHGGHSNGGYGNGGYNNGRHSNAGYANAGHGATSFNSVVSHGQGYGGYSNGDNAHQQEHHAPAHYKFDYAVHDPHTHDIKNQWESRDGDVVKGSYSLLEADGTTRTVDYTADHHNGFNAVVRKSGHAHHPQVYENGGHY